MAMLLVFIVIALLLGCLIAGIVLWSTSGSGGSGEMSCGACGYAVRGLTQLNCPECGVDLREAGINKGASVGRRATGMILTIGSLSVFLLFFLLSVFFFSRRYVAELTTRDAITARTQHFKQFLRDPERRRHQYHCEPRWLADHRASGWLFDPDPTGWDEDYI